MKLTGKEAAVLLTDDGRQVVQLAKIGLPETHLLLVVIQETEDLESGSGFNEAKKNTASY